MQGSNAEIDLRGSDVCHYVASGNKEASDTIRVLLVNCSDAELEFLKDEVEKDGRIKVIGMARNAHEARNMVMALNPDLLIMDILDPQAGGIDFIKRLNRYYPRPVLLVSPMSRITSQLALSAFEAGVSDIVDKDALILLNHIPAPEQFFLSKKIKALTF